MSVALCHTALAGIPPKRRFSMQLFPLSLPAARFAPETGTASGSRPPSDPATPVIEIVSFRLRSGVGTADFLAAAETTRAALQDKPGFLARWLSHGEDGLWTDLVHWSDAASARTAAAEVMADPGFARFLNAIDPESVQMAHRPILWRMGD
jgi:hypothetical protein